jgi:hypothetical protein
VVRADLARRIRLLEPKIVGHDRRVETHGRRAAEIEAARGHLEVALPFGGLDVREVERHTAKLGVAGVDVPELELVYLQARDLLHVSVELRASLRAEDVDFHLGEALHLHVADRRNLFEIDPRVRDLDT